jgi:hypothetical protein
MPDELPITTANITIANVKDVPYARNDGTQAVFKSLGHKNTDGTWLNLSCFDELIFPLLVKSNTLTVGYTEKWATLANGQPKLYNGVQTVYRTIVSAELVSGAQQTSPQNGSTSTPAAATGKYDPGLGAYQTALNCASTVWAAIISTGNVPEDFVSLVLETAHSFHGYLTTGKVEEIDQLISKAKSDMGAEEIDPDYEAGRDAQESLSTARRDPSVNNDDEIPFG